VTGDWASCGGSFWRLVEVRGMLFCGIFALFDGFTKPKKLPSMFWFCGGELKMFDSIECWTICC